MPELPSCQWVGQDRAQELQTTGETSMFHREVPECDAVVFVLFKPDENTLSRIP